MPGRRIAADAGVTSEGPVTDPTINRIRVYAYASAPHQHPWDGEMAGGTTTITFLRLTASDGSEGVSAAMSGNPHCHDSVIAETIRTMMPAIRGMSPLACEANWRRLRELGSPQTLKALAAVDTASWDLAGKIAGLPLYRMLGGARDRVLSYASIPVFADIPAYHDYIADLQAQGFRAVKLHCWCDAERDLPLVRAVAERFAESGLRFMLDVEQLYSRTEALAVARELERLGFVWFEAPLPDTDFEGYVELRRRVGIPILPAGAAINDPGVLRHAAAMGCWSSFRVDAEYIGGITPLRKAMALGEAHGMSVEVLCWGHSLVQAANLHVILAYANCDYFEQSVPYDDFEHCMLDVIRTEPDGFVHAPEGPGLGLRVDWEAVEAGSIQTFDSADEERGVRK